MQRKPYFVFVLSCITCLSALLLSFSECQAEPPAGRPQCSYYRSKKEKVPVYAEPDTTSKVVSRLKLGQEVCYLGEQSGFAIVDWREKNAGLAPPPETENKDEDKPGAPAGGPAPEANAGIMLDQNLAYIRLVDLWPPRAGKSLSTTRKSIGQRLSDFYTYIRSGGVPEEPVIPLGLPDGPEPGQVPNVVPGSGADKDDNCGCDVKE